MLAELIIENCAVIEKLRVRFNPGLNVLTGETGSGKSIVVDAVGLLLGARTSPELVRTGAEKARVSGIFQLPEAEEVRALLDSAGIEVDGDEVLIEREVLANGKSRAFVGSRPVTASLLRQLAPYLADIHGQHEHQRLFQPEAQLEMLDQFAGTSELVQKVRELFRQWSQTKKELDELERAESERQRLADLWSFQQREIEAVAPRPGEDNELEAERNRLRNFARLEEGVRSAYEGLYDAPESALSRLRSAVRRMEELARVDQELGAVADMLRPTALAVEEASFLLRDYLARLEFSPERLEEVENRLAALQRLKKKYGPELSDVLRYLEEIKARQAAAEESAVRGRELQQRLEELGKSYEEAAGELSSRRKEAALRLERRLEEELARLAMERALFRVAFSRSAWMESGFDEVTFMISANPGEEVRPLERVASGGELSRVALALKSCIAEGAGSPGSTSLQRTLVFDEVDAGIGGRVAEMVGRKLKLLARGNQVLCVTHLPQIACFADHHFCVEKSEEAGRVTARVRELNEEERVQEIARMLSGARLTREAFRHAEQLLKSARR